MTLIAAFKCSEGYVLCADSEITVTDDAGNKSRVSRQKLLPVSIGGVEVAIAGAGDGEVIEACVARLERNLKGTSLVKLDQLRQIVCDEVGAFAKDKGIQPLEIGDYIRLLVAVHSPGIGSDVWKTIMGDPVNVGGYALIGYDDTRYEYAVKNLYRPEMPISQGVFLCLYLMWLAEQTTPHIKAPITVAIVKDSGIAFENQAKIDSLTSKVRTFAIAFESQLLACSDTGIQNAEFAVNFKEFGKTIVQFRQDFIADWVADAVDRGLENTIALWNEIPTGTTIVLDPQSAENQRIQQLLVDSLRVSEDGKQEPQRIKANLETIRNWRQKLLQQLSGGEGPTEQEQAEGARSFEENMQAATMGAYKTTQEVVNCLARVHHFLTTSTGLGRHVDLQLEIMCLNQTLDYLARTTALTPNSSEGQP